MAAVSYVSDVTSAIQMAKDAAARRTYSSTGGHRSTGARRRRPRRTAGPSDPGPARAGSSAVRGHAADHIELELLRALDGPGVLHLRYRVRRKADDAIIRLYMTMSLDGYITGPQDSVDAPLGIDGFRLFNCSTGATTRTSARCSRAMSTARHLRPPYLRTADRCRRPPQRRTIFVLTHDIPTTAAGSVATSPTCAMRRAVPRWPGTAT